MAILCFTQHHFNTLNVSTRMFYNQVSDNDCKLHQTINKHSSVQARERGEGYFIHFCNQDKYVYFSICHLLSALWTQCENNESWTWLQCEYLNELWALWALVARRMYCIYLNILIIEIQLLQSYCSSCSI